MHFGERPETKCEMNGRLWDSHRRPFILASAQRLSANSDFQCPPRGNGGSPDQMDTLAQEFEGTLPICKVWWGYIKLSGVFFFPATVRPLGGAWSLGGAGRGVPRDGGPPLHGSSPAWVWEPGSRNQEKINKFIRAKIMGVYGENALACSSRLCPRCGRPRDPPPAGPWRRPGQLDQQPGCQNFVKNDRVQNEWKSMGTAVPGLSTGGRATSGARGPRENRSRSSRGTRCTKGGRLCDHLAGLQ